MDYSKIKIEVNSNDSRSDVLRSIVVEMHLDHEYMMRSVYVGGNLTSKTRLRNKLLDGYSEFYSFGDGALRATVNYRRGKVHGLYRAYTDGRVTEEMFFVRGKNVIDEVISHGIDVDNITDEDELFLSVKYG